MDHKTERPSNLEALRSLHDRLVVHRESAAEQERWTTLSGDAQRILEACEGRDLEQVAAAVRTIKNRMRRPSIRKELARLDESKEKEEKPKGKCNCAHCGAVINGSKEPCLKDALCTKCGTEGKVPKGEKEKSKEPEGEKASNKDDAHVGESSYRRRSY
jgi:hypothetical protein